ncbi:MAG: DedA family protein [Dehalococcoidia bacterium]
MLGAPLEFLGWITDQLFLTINALFDRFGIPIVFASGLAEATLGVGVVFPGVIIMFLGGAYAAGEPLQLVAVWGVAIAGTALGDTISYGVGRWGGRYLERTRFGPSLRLGSALMQGRARWFIPFYHLYSVTRAVGPFGAGAVRMPLRAWLPLDYLGAAIANAVWVAAGAVFGTAVLTSDGRLEQHPALRIGLVVAGMLWFLMLRRVAQSRLRELARVPVAAEGVPAADGGEPAGRPQ